MDLSRYKVSVPEGQSGKWRVEHFVISELDSQFSMLHAVTNEGRGYVPPGQYTRLIQKTDKVDGVTRSGVVQDSEVLVMSDTPDEVADHLPAILHGRSHCLVDGLGLGMVTRALLERREVSHVTVVEASADVITLVAPSLQEHLDSGRLTIIHHDAFRYRPPPGVRYGMVWHDIWDTISDANLPQMERLHRKYGRRADWQGSWARKQCEWMRDVYLGRANPFQPPDRPLTDNPDMARRYTSFRNHMKRLSRAATKLSIHQNPNGALD